VKNRLDVLVSATVTAGFAVLTALLAYETWALYTGHRPLTSYIRPAVRDYPGVAFLIAVVVGLLLGHLLWGRREGPTAVNPSP
jgi:hypothetical protein